MGGMSFTQDNSADRASKQLSSGGNNVHRFNAEGDAVPTLLVPGELFGARAWGHIGRALFLKGDDIFRCPEDYSSNGAPHDWYSHHIMSHYTEKINGICAKQEWQKQRHLRGTSTNTNELRFKV